MSNIPTVLPNPNYYPTPAPNNDTGVIIAVILIIVCLLCGLGYYLYSESSTTTTTPVPTKQPTPSPPVLKMTQKNQSCSNYAPPVKGYITSPRWNGDTCSPQNPCSYGDAIFATVNSPEECYEACTSSTRVSKDPNKDDPPLCDAFGYSSTAKTNNCRFRPSGCLGKVENKSEFDYYTVQ